MNRYSSRRQRLDRHYFTQALAGARSYDRIAGYFSSSLLEIAGEAIEGVGGKVRIVCNSDLHPEDVKTARAAELALKKEWTTKIDGQIAVAGKSRFARLYDLLITGKLEVRVLANEHFGLIHGKAGVITRADGSKTCFLGSVNETLSAWKLNYELLWEDDTPESVAWVQEEFDSLWNSPFIKPLSEAIIQDIGRIAERQIIPIEEWAKPTSDPAAALIEAPVYRKEYGLWTHQKYFIARAFEEHRSERGARFVLADMVGLGKTIQLAASAQLMALYGDKPVLIVVPKPLIWQWQGEMATLLDMPSAVWDGRRWVDEAGIEHPVLGIEGIRQCPRRVGIVSQGLFTRLGPIVDHILKQQFECVIIDECHRARRRNLSGEGPRQSAEPNNLMAFARAISRRTKSMLLGTATPVQLHPIEAYDLLDILAQGSEHVLGNDYSLWRGDKMKGLAIAMGEEPIPTDADEVWNYARNPLPLSHERENLFGSIRRDLQMEDAKAVASGNDWYRLKPALQNRLQRQADEVFSQFNPYIRHIIRRTRDYLETTIDPATNEPYLDPVRVELFGERPDEAVLLPGYLEDAYHTAEEFCQKIGKRVKSAGFLKMLLLKRIGSSIQAGTNTAIRMLEGNAGKEEEYEEEDEEVETSTDFKDFTSQERGLLSRLITQLERHKEKDPKYLVMRSLLTNKRWADRGCIIFSQYFDTAHYMASQFASEYPELEIGLYAGGTKAGVFHEGRYEPKAKEDLKKRVQSGQIKILFGTDAASEGLNLQRLATLINIDLPWNPTRLEQRKGRIQRIGQVHPTVWIYNMRYRNSVEDRVHEMLSERLENIHSLFGQLPDVLEDAWVRVAQGKEDEAKAIIDEVPRQHPFKAKYEQLGSIDWEGCTKVLSLPDQQLKLRSPW